MNVRAHTCYLGHTGFNSHARSFFRELAKHVNLRVRNYTWDEGYNSYINSTDRSILDTVTLMNGNGSSVDRHASVCMNGDWVDFDSNFIEDVDIVLMDTNHFYFYQEYKAKIRIAYLVWESTHLPDEFFNRINSHFTHVWVVSQWHKDMIVKQGLDESRVFIVNEGVDPIFNDPAFPIRVIDDYSDDRFKFLFFGRWDYRKSVPEIIKAFLTEFGQDEPIDLILSADDPFNLDRLNSTNERLQRYDLVDDRIKVKHFVNRQDYVSYLMTGHVFVSCARSEGWNIPLMEAMAAGTPAIYSNCTGQLEFTKGHGIPVNVLGESPAALGSQLGVAPYAPGNYALPDYEDLAHKMRDAYVNYKSHKAASDLDKTRINTDFSWERVTQQAVDCLNAITIKPVQQEPNGESAVIMTHANTPEKIDLLRRSVTELKRQGFTTIVSSHIQVPDDIYEMSDFVVYDKQNPVIRTADFAKYSTHAPVYWINHPDFYLTYPFDFNHGYAVMRLIKNAVAVSAANCFPVTHFVNYDYIISNPDTLQSHSRHLNSADVVSYFWGEDRNSLNTGIFSVKTDRFFDVAKRVNSIADYFSSGGSVIFENVLFTKMKEAGLTMYLETQASLQKSGNSLNQNILTIKKIIEIDGDPDASIVFGKENGTQLGYLALIASQNKPIRAILEAGQTSKEFNVQAGGHAFITIPESVIDEGFKVNLPNTNEVKEHSRSTQTATFEIRNRKSIVKLVDGLTEQVEENIAINFVKGPYVEITGKGSQRYKIEFIDADKNEVVYESTIGINCWSRCHRKYYVNWLIRITNLTTDAITEHKLDLGGKRVVIAIESSSLGDSISWFAHIEEFQIKHNCKLLVSSFKNELFEKNYPNLTFIGPGVPVKDVYASYQLGWYYGDNDTIDTEYHPREVKDQPMQTTVTDILGLPQSQAKPRLVVKDSTRPIADKYVCLGMHATAQAKYWNNPTGWQEITDYYVSRGYKVVMLSTEGDNYMGNVYPTGLTKISQNRSLESTISYLKHCEIFIGIGSGLSWLAWAVGVPTVLISGFSKPYTEMYGKDVIRVFNNKSCNGCFNRIRLDAGDWNWCPDKKGTDRQFECTKSITASMVIDEIEKYESRKAI